MTRKQLGACGFALVICGAAATASTQTRPPQPQPSALDGTFVYAGDAAQLAAMREAIAAATSALPASERAVWRAQLDQIARPQPRLVMQRADADFVVKSGPAEVRTPSNGTRAAVKGDWEVEQRLTDDVLEQRIDNGTIAQVRTFAISADRRTLMERVRITAPALSRPIEFTLAYQTQG